MARAKPLLGELCIIACPSEVKCLIMHVHHRVRQYVQADDDEDDEDEFDVIDTALVCLEFRVYTEQDGS